MPKITDLTPAAAQVRTFDRERFVTALFASESSREDLMVLYAFNVELSRIRESVTEPVAGLIRLQWWRDTLAAAVDGQSIDHHHPVAGALAGLLLRYGLGADLFEAMLEAREADLAPDGPADMAAAEAYAAQTAGVLARIALLLLGERGEGAAEAARQMGIAWGLLGHVRALGAHLSMGRLTIPLDVLAEAGTDADAVRAGRAPLPALCRSARIMAEAARGHLAMARRERVGRQALAAMLPAVLADGHLRVLARAGWNPFDARVQTPQPQPLRLAWASLRGRF